MRSYTAIFLLTVSSLYSQKILDPDVVGLRVNGRLLARFPVVVEGGPVIVEFDVKGGQPIDARVRITHCSREWRATESEFVNDPARMTLRQPISHRRAPQGTRAYAWTYRFGLPGIKGLEEFTYSGNYTATILEAASRRPPAAMPPASQSTSAGRSRPAAASGSDHERQRPPATPSEPPQSRSDRGNRLTQPARLGDAGSSPVAVLARTERRPD